MHNMESSKENLKILVERMEFLKEEVKKYKYDSLTGLKQKIDFDSKLVQLFEEFEFEDKPFCFILVDADGLHNVNYLEGREAGDELLIGIANRIKSFFTEFGTDIYRISGDEFGIFVTNTDQCSGETSIELNNATCANVWVCDGTTFATPSQVYKEADRLLSIKKADKKLAARV